MKSEIIRTLFAIAQFGNNLVSNNKRLIFHTKGNYSVIKNNAVKNGLIGMGKYVN